MPSPVASRRILPDYERAFSANQSSRVMWPTRASLPGRNTSPAIAPRRRVQRSSRRARVSRHGETCGAAKGVGSATLARFRQDGDHEKGVS